MFNKNDDNKKNLDEEKLVEEEENVEDKNSSGENETKECENCAKSKKEADEYKQGWQRALADYNNLQKETKHRMAEWIQMSEQQILEEFIPVYDNFKKAFAHHPELDTSSDESKKIKNWIDGIGYIMKQFGEVLKAHKVEEIKTVGQKFDPKFHETVSEEEVEGKESGEIIKEVDGGYMLGDKVIKAAKVVVVK
jgi:molecular chaperone GrpE